MRDTIIALLVFFTAVVCTPLYAAPPQSDVLSGSISLEREAKKRDPYLVAQDNAIRFLNRLEKFIAEPANPINPQTLVLDDQTLQYLGAVYLFCSVRKGACPSILDALLESDIIYSAAKNDVSCPNLKRFWKLWVKNDMEKRHKYMVKTGFLKQTADFNANKRPTYIRCEATIEQTIGKEKRGVPFFKKRYKDPSPIAISINIAGKLVRLLKKKNINVYRAIGMKR
ncbi:MAG: hypothetical protein D6719_09180 [Candidatus Dadabacteria bacterium]|nr:MAG: hypothetical protein D6719_09180 [Candidatus Dadabacteria bacterium]